MVAVCFYGMLKSWIDPIERRELVRDFGVHVPNSEDDNSFEDAKENPAYTRLENVALLPIPESSSWWFREWRIPRRRSRSEQYDSQSGSQVVYYIIKLTTFLQFNRNRGEAFVNWLECLEAAKDAYNWSENALAVQVAKAKGRVWTRWPPQRYCGKCAGLRQWILSYAKYMLWI